MIMEKAPTQPIYNVTGEKVGEMALPELFLSSTIKKNFLSQVVVMNRKNARRPTAHTRGRSDVRGGGRKPWRQKGTGRARHGSIRSPIWKGGGVAHGPTKNRDLKVKINKKAGRGALAMVLAEKARSNKIFVVQDFGGMVPKTKNFLSVMRLLLKNSIPHRFLVVTAEPNETIGRGSRNVAGAAVKTARNVNVMDVLVAESVIISKDAFQILLKRVV